MDTNKLIDLIEKAGHYAVPHDPTLGHGSWEAGTSHYLVCIEVDLGVEPQTVLNTLVGMAENENDRAYLAGLSVGSKPHGTGTMLYAVGVDWPKGRGCTLGYVGDDYEDDFDEYFANN